MKWQALPYNSPTALAMAPRLDIGTRIGAYEITAVLGAGGMGIAQAVRGGPASQTRDRGQQLPQGLDVTDEGPRH